MRGIPFPTGRSTGSLLVALCAIVLFAAACGDDSDDSADSDGSATTPDDGGENTVNACPDDGCSIQIDDAVADGDEITITWTANFSPDVARNHIHVYWLSLIHI